MSKDLTVLNSLGYGLDDVLYDTRTGKYYVIDLSAMENLTLNYGEDYELIKNEPQSNIATLKNNTLTDLYIINFSSHNIFYVEGIKYGSTVYYKEYQDDENADIGLSEITFDNLEENWSPMYETTKKYIDKNTDTAIIPKGFRVSRKTGEDTIENGLVVRDINENQWVWIPVSSEDLNKMYESCTSNNELLIENNTTKVATPYKSKSSTDIVSYLIRGDINSTDWREPAILKDSSLDGNENNRREAGFLEENGNVSSLETMATKLKDDYKDMIDSIRKYGGFYVARYELGKNGTTPQVKAGNLMNGINWYTAYSACKSFSGESVESRMIWGCQWDQVCRFMHEHGDKVDLNNSITYGNYTNSSGEVAVNSRSLGTPPETGTRNKLWQVNNIYDFAGNGLEWSQEAYDTYSRGYRGGICDQTGTSYPVCSRVNNWSTDVNNNNTSRPTLYIK